jgi:hypothetical protein
MNRNDSSDDTGGTMSHNTTPKEDERSLSKEDDSAKERRTSSRWLTVAAADLRRQSKCQSYSSSCVGSTFPEKSRTTSRAEIINSALSALTNEGVSLSEILQAIDPSPQRDKVSNIEVGLSSPGALLNKDESPVVPRRSSEPCLIGLTRPEFRRRVTHTDGMQHDFSTMSIFQLDPPLTRRSEERERQTRKSKSQQLEGFLLEYSDRDDSEIDSDLTKTDPEDDSLQEKSKKVPTVVKIPSPKISSTSPPTGTSSWMSSMGVSPRPRRGRRKQHRENDLPLEDAPISPSQFNRRGMPTSDTSKVELSGSPAAARLSIGKLPGTTTRMGRGRGRSPREYRSARAERRWSESSRPRQNSVDRTPSTPTRINRSGRRGEMRWSVHSQKKNDSVDHILETPKRGTHGKVELISLVAPDSKSPPNEVSDTERAKKFQYQSPNISNHAPAKESQGGSFNSPLETTPSGTDKRTPTTPGPTPSRGDSSEDLRESFDCPPPL